MMSINPKGLGLLGVKVSPQSTMKLLPYLINIVSGLVIFLDFSINQGTFIETNPTYKKYVELRIAYKHLKQLV